MRSCRKNVKQVPNATSNDCHAGQPASPRSIRDSDTAQKLNDAISAPCAATGKRSAWYIHHVRAKRVIRGLARGPASGERA